MSKLDFSQVAADLASKEQKDRELKSIEAWLLKKLFIAIRIEGDKQDMARKFLELLGDKQELSIELIDFLERRLEALKLQIKTIEQQREINRLFSKNNAGGRDE